MGHVRVHCMANYHVHTLSNTDMHLDVCYNYWSFIASLVLEILFLWLYADFVDLDWDFYGTTTIIAQSSIFWLIIFFVPMVAGILTSNYYVAG